MNRICSALLLLASVRPFVVSAEPPAEPQASFNFVNAVNVASPTFLSIDGRRYKPKGYIQGAFSVGGQLEAGSHAFAVENENCRPIVKTVEMPKGFAATFLAYVVEKAMPDGTVERQLRLIQQPHQKAGAGYSFTAIYVSDRPSATIYVNGRQVDLPALKAAKLEPRGPFQVSAQPPRAPARLAADRDGVTYTPDVPGSYLLVVFDSGRNSLLFRLVQNGR